MSSPCCQPWESNETSMPAARWWQSITPNPREKKGKQQQKTACIVLVDVEGTLFPKKSRGGIHRGSGIIPSSKVKPVRPGASIGQARDPHQRPISRVRRADRVAQRCRAPDRARAGKAKASLKRPHWRTTLHYATGELPGPDKCLKNGLLPPNYGELIPFLWVV